MTWYNYRRAQHKKARLKREHVKGINMKKLERLDSDNISETFKMQAIERQVKEILPHWHDFYELELCLEGTGTP